MSRNRADTNKRTQSRKFSSKNWLENGTRTK